MSRIAPLFAAAPLVLAVLGSLPAQAQVGDLGPSLEESLPVDPCQESGEGEDVIVVCRQFESGERYTFDAPTRADSEVTGGGAPRAPDVFGMPPCSAYNVCVRFGSVPPPAIMVDFASLPETPAGSEAALLYGGPTAAEEPASAAQSDGEQAAGPAASP